MSLVSTFKNDNQIAELPFPKLMINRRCNLVILFTEKGSGTVVYCETNDNHIGEFDARWSTGLFADFYGDINIRNGL